jgi:hypothetical protein
MKLQRCRELLAAKMQQGKNAHTTVNYLEELMDFYLSKKDPCMEKSRPCDRTDKPSHSSNKVSDRSNNVSNKNPSSKKSSWTSESAPIASLTSEKEVTRSTFMTEMENSSSCSIAKMEVENKSRVKIEATSEKEVTEHKNKPELIFITTIKDELIDNESESITELRDQRSTCEANYKKPTSEEHQFSLKNQKIKGPQLSLKKQIFQKWKECQFHDPLTGRKCGEKFQLEMEHLHPRWAGGKDHIENRTLLCRTHNQWKYRQQAGLH